MRLKVLKKNIVFKLTIGYIFIIMISTLLLGAFFIDLFKNYTLKSRQENMFKKANEVAKMVEPYMAQPQDLSIYNSMINIVDSFVNSRVWIADSEGSVILMSNNRLGNSGQFNVKQFDEEFANSILKGRQVIKEDYNKYLNELTFSVGVPIKSSSNEVLGMVVFNSPMSGVTSSIDRAFEFLVYAIILEIILSGILGFYYSKFITRPIKLMNQSAIEMTNGNFKVRTNIFQKDEIGELSNSLDILASKLEYTLDRLFQEKNKLEDLFSSMSEGILAFDAGMKLVNYNESAQKFFGYGTNNFGSSLKQDFQRYGISDDLMHVIEHGEKKTIIKPWEGRILRFSVSPVKDNILRTIGAVVLVEDISEQEKLEQMRKDFVANVSHEFRTPLTLIRGNLESLVDGVVTGDQVPKHYDKLLQETKRLERMVSDLLDLSKLQSGKVNFSFEEIDVVTLVQDVSRSMQFIADKKCISIETSIKQDMPAVSGDYDKIRQLLIIFIDNAIKYSNEGSKITISADAGEYVYIEIKDNGIGIPKDEIPYIWDRFYKIDKSRRSSNEGTGLGLAIAKYLVEFSRGTISILSEVGSGTTIKLGLPLHHKAIL